MALMRELAKERGWRRVLKERLYGLLWIYDSEWGEGISACLSIIRGMVLLAPLHTFTGSPAYEVFVNLGIHEWGIGLLFAVAGSAQLAMLMLDHTRGRKWAALAQGSLHMFIGASNFLSDPRQVQSYGNFFIAQVNFHTTQRISERGRGG